MRNGCTCTRTGTTLCAWCTTLAQRAGVLTTPPKPQLPSLQVRYPEEAAMQQLWQVAEAHGWVPDMHFFPSAKYRGLWGEFIRGTRVLRVLVYRDDEDISGDQRLWLDALHQTGKFEVVTCPTSDLSAVRARLQEGTP